MSARSRELVTTDESTVVTKTALDPIVVENFECDGRFSNSTCTDESDGLEIFGETDDGLN